VQGRLEPLSVGCDLIFHNGGKQILNYQNCWRSACVGLGLGAWYCRDCRDVDGVYISKFEC
jgi:hypothetical protein